MARVLWVFAVAPRSVPTEKQGQNGRGWPSGKTEGASCLANLLGAHAARDCFTSPLKLIPEGRITMKRANTTRKPRTFVALFGSVTFVSLRINFLFSLNTLYRNNYFLRSIIKSIIKILFLEVKFKLSKNFIG